MATEYTITAFLWKSTKVLGQASFFFLILLLVTGGFLINQGEPNSRYVYLQAGQTGSIEINAKNSFQLAVFYQPTDKEPDRTITFEVRVIDTDNGGVVFYGRGKFALLQNLEVPAGNYRVEVTNLTAMDYGVQIAFASFDLKVAFAFIVLSIMFIVAFAGFWSVSPLLVAVLLINALSGKSTKLEDKTTTAVKTIGDPTSLRHDFRTKEWVMSILAFIFVVFISYDEVFFVLFIIFSSTIIVTVIRRNRARNRIAALLDINPSIHINEVMKAVGESNKRKMEDILNYMILDLGYPIRYNRVDNMVARIGDIKPFLGFQGLRSLATDTPVVHRHDEETSIKEKRSVEVQTYSKQSVKEKKVEIVENFHCVTCGQELPQGTKYCYSCGSKQ